MPLAYASLMRLLEHLGLAVIFAADEDVGDVALRGHGGRWRCLRASVRIVIHQIAILERARLGFIGVDGQIVRPLFFLGDERPFLPRREPRPAAAAQAGIGDES
jgi:hypothetical protein